MMPNSRPSSGTPRSSQSALPCTFPSTTARLWGDCEPVKMHATYFLSHVNRESRRSCLINPDSVLVRSPSPFLRKKQ